MVIEHKHRYRNVQGKDLLMKEYTRHIDEYFDHWVKHHNTLLPASEWGDKASAQVFLEKYWLPEYEYGAEWRNMQNQIFLHGTCVPDMIFQDDYEIIATIGGCLFLEDTFKKIQSCFVELGDRFFVVIEDTFGGIYEEPLFRMKFPADITWDELKSGNYISAMILNASHKQYYVFGSTSSWGKYSASEADMPLDLTGFLPQHAGVFRKRLQVSDDERKEIASWLPPKYKMRCNVNFTRQP